VLGLAWSNDPESHTDSSVDTGRAPTPKRQKEMMTQILWYLRLGGNRQLHLLKFLSVAVR